MVSDEHSAPRLRLISGGSERHPPSRRRASRHLRLMAEHLRGVPLRAAAEGIGSAVGVTQTELLISRAKLFGGGTVRCYRLSTVSAVELHPRASVSRLHVTVDGHQLVLLYPSRSAIQFEVIASLVRRRMIVGQRKKSLSRCLPALHVVGRWRLLPVPTT